MVIITMIVAVFKNGIGIFQLDLSQPLIVVVPIQTGPAGPALAPQDVCNHDLSSAGHTDPSHHTPRFPHGHVAVVVSLVYLYGEFSINGIIIVEFLTFEHHESIGAIVHGVH